MTTTIDGRDELDAIRAHRVCSNWRRSAPSKWHFAE